MIHVQHVSAPAALPAGPFQMQTLFTGTAQCLTLDKERYVIMLPCGKNASQMWTATYDPTYQITRLRNQLAGDDRCLGIRNDGIDDTPMMVPCGNRTGQMWTLSVADEYGTRHLRSRFTGDAMCLDIVNDHVNNNIPHMAACGNYSGQRWTF